jgi:PKD repeat protein
MKKNGTSLIFIAMLLMLSGCYKDPQAQFTMSASSIEVGESVNFLNTSMDMDRCEWIFGDGGQSTETNPSHSYTDPGAYQVTLRVFSKQDMKADQRTDVVTVIQPTYLNITVYDYESNDPLSGATVVLYTTEDDFYSDTNSIVEGETSSSGLVSFKNVPAMKIYISVYKYAYEQNSYTYFYSNWFINLDGNTYNTMVEANQINGLDIYARLGYTSSSGRLAKNTVK